MDAETIERFRTRLRWKVCHHLGGFCPDVDDVVQETLVRFLAALRDNTVRNPENLGAYLSGVCNNVIREYRRKLWREPLVDSDAPPLEDRVRPETEIYEAREAIASVMAGISERDRKLLNLFYLQEMDGEEICRQEGLSALQFRVALFRAKARFRRVYLQQVKQAASGPH